MLVSCVIASNYVLVPLRRSALRHRVVLMSMAIAVASALAFAVYLAPDLASGVPHDMIEYRELALQLQSGQYCRWDVPPCDPVPYPTPGYPAILAIVYAMAGPNDVATVGLNAAMYAGIVGMLAWLTAAVWTIRAGVFASLLAATFLPFGFYSGLRMTEIFATFLMVVLGCSVLYAVWRRTAAAWALCGAVIGALALVRPLFIVFGIVAVVIALALTRRAAVAAACMTTCALVLMPWIAYTILNFGSVIPSAQPTNSLFLGSTWSRVFDNRTAAELYTLSDASSAVSDEELRQVLTSRASNDREFQDMYAYVIQHRWVNSAHREADRLRGHERILAIRALAARELDFGMENVRREPLRFLRQRTLDWPRSFAENTPMRQSDIGRMPAAVRVAYWGFQAVLVALALIGAFVAFRRRSSALLFGIPPLVLLIAMLPFAPDARYLVPAWPFILGLAGVALAAWTSRAREAS